MITVMAATEGLCRITITHPKIGCSERSICKALCVTFAGFLVQNHTVMYMIMRFRPTRERHKNQSIVKAKAEISFEG